MEGLPALRLGELVSPEDFFRHQLCHALFFRPLLLRSLRQVRYAFPAREQQDAARAFTAAMDALDDRWRGSGFPTSEEIAHSLQY